MTISKVAKSTKLTKKAIRYYESVGLIKSNVLENGYLDYSKEVVDKLNIIRTLRELSFSIEEIKSCFLDEETLQSKFSLKSKQLQLDKEQLSSTIEFLNNCISQELKLSDIAECKGDAVNRPKQLRVQLQQLFPGDFGEIIAAVYGQFLNEEILTVEQEEAWNTLIIELDEIEPFEIPQNLALWAVTTNNKREELESNVTRLKDEYNQSYEVFNENKKDAINDYLNQSNNRLEASSNQELLMFLSSECGEVVEILGKYLPLVSKSYQHFFLKQQRFFQENGELIDKLK